MFVSKLKLVYKKNCIHVNLIFYLATKCYFVEIHDHVLSCNMTNISDESCPLSLKIITNISNESNLLFLKIIMFPWFQFFKEWPSTYNFHMLLNLESE